MKKIYVFGLIVSLVLTASSCKKKKQDGFDRTGLLTNLGNSVIVPGYQQLAGAMNDLQNKSGAFGFSPSLDALDSLQHAFLQSYLKFEAIETYSFSAAADMRNQFNSFPPDTNQINNNIASGSYDLSTVNNLRAKGFPALDYLLFSKNDQQIVDLFSTDISAQKRRQYLADIISEISSAASAASSEWSGNYMSTFTGASGTDIGSSVGILVNDMSFASERCRRERVGNAVGYTGLMNTGVINPISVEAYYSIQSKELLIQNLQRLKELFTGATGAGFDDYLNYVNAEYNGEPLSSVITDQFDLVILKTQNIPADFSTAVGTHKPEMESLFLELKKLTVLLKVDMSSQLGVIINYSDYDGD